MVSIERAIAEASSSLREDARSFRSTPLANNPHKDAKEPVLT